MYGLLRECAELWVGLGPERSIGETYLVCTLGSLICTFEQVEMRRQQHMGIEPDQKLHKDCTSAFDHVKGRFSWQTWTGVCGGQRYGGPVGLSGGNTVHVLSPGS
ncbi:hypothetical protein M8818_002980 [Zalaria obscura]|uniref:Uncharacterized protein n=1 Tax=Zalaria obscura TaxID=2024903 RepID=A0ACC3SFM4_9PEZI